jgi:NADH-quinone oxidoreductase subunit L
LALAGAFITAFYTTRLILVVFWGELKTPVGKVPGRAITIPLMVLALFSIAGGFIEWPRNLLRISLFSDFIQKVLPVTVEKENPPSEFSFQAIASAVTLAGGWLGYILYYQKKELVGKWQQSSVLMNLRNFLFSGWKFDELYDTVFVKPFVYITRINKDDVFDRLYNGIAKLSLRLNGLVSTTQNGSLRWYIVGVLIGILFIISLQLLL